MQAWKMASRIIRCRGCFNITVENASVTLNSGDRLCVCVCVCACTLMYCVTWRVWPKKGLNRWSKVIKFPHLKETLRRLRSPNCPGRFYKRPLQFLPWATLIHSTRSHNCVSFHLPLGSQSGLLPLRLMTTILHVHLLFPPCMLHVLLISVCW
jgi:hypothetical protein